MGYGKRSLWSHVTVLLIVLGMSGQCQGALFEMDEILDALKNERIVPFNG